MVKQKITKDPESERIQKEACMKCAGGHSWKVRLKHEVWAQANIAVNLEMASAKESTYFSLSKKMSPQKPSSVENDKEIRWDVLGAIAYANGHNGEGASAAPPKSAAAGKVADLMGGTLSYIVNWISCSSSKCSSELGIATLQRCTHH